MYVYLNFYILGNINSVLDEIYVVMYYVGFSLRVLGVPFCTPETSDWLLEMLPEWSTCTLETGEHHPSLSSVLLTVERRNTFLNSLQ